MFSEEEINNMKVELDKYGLHLPAFNKIGGILAKELSVDEAAGRRCGWGGQRARGVADPLGLCHQSMLLCSPSTRRWSEVIWRPRRRL